MERVNRRGAGRSVTMYAQFASTGGEEPADRYEERTRFWWRPPDTLREETEASPPRRSHTTVIDGELWWSYNPDWGAISNVDLDEEERAHHSTGGGDRFQPLLDPSGFLATLRFSDVSSDGDRLYARAVPRDDLPDAGMHFRLHGIGGADELRFEVDRAIGIVHRITGYLDGEELSQTELEEIVLDEAFPAETFVFVSPPGEEVRPPESARHRVHTLEEAAVAAPFIAFFVPELPEGDWRLRVHFSEARRRPPTAAHLGLIYTRADGRGSIVFSQRAAGEGGISWTGYGPPELGQLERDGISYSVMRGDPDQGRQNTVSWERDGTALQLRSAEIDLEALLDLATTVKRTEESE
jgi:outer membrane lipoprotein-sorting protein